MITNDATILKVKHEVNYQIAKLAWEGKLNDGIESLPYEMIPGPQAQYRCCVYKEREIIKQRIRLAIGKAPINKDDTNIIQVINAACEECPISSYVVTDNCRQCLGKACQNSCKFGAVSMGRHRAYIEASKCKECGKCAQACPYNAIAHLERPCKKACPAGAISYDDYGICVIDEAKCIRCGQCIHSCPFGAISSKTSITQVINAILSGKKVIAMVAPATEGQFGKDITMASWKTGLMKAGFSGMMEVSLGADVVAASEAEEWAEAYAEGKKKSTSCCPAFVNFINKHYPDLKDIISETVSPMCAVSRIIKKEDPDAVTVFIGPCIAKKSEASEHGIEGNADYALTYGEIRAILRAKEIELQPEENSLQEGSQYGKRFGNSGGVTAAVLQSLKETDEAFDAKVAVCNGAAECKKALLMLKAGKLSEDFIEGMICMGGCVGGSSKHKTEQESKVNRDFLINSADNRSIHGNIEKMGVGDIDLKR